MLLFANCGSVLCSPAGEKLSKEIFSSDFALQNLGRLLCVALKLFLPEQWASISTLASSTYTWVETLIMFCLEAPCKCYNSRFKVRLCCARMGN